MRNLVKSDYPKISPRSTGSDQFVDAQLDGFEAKAALAAADAGSLLAASGDLIHTGPTGTNVMDLVLGLKL